MTDPADQEKKPDEPARVQAVEAGPWQVDPGLDSAQLLSRMVAGTLLFGSAELTQRLRVLQREIQANPELLWRYSGPEGDGVLEAFQDLAMGLYMRGQRTLSRGVRSGLYQSLNMANWAVTKVDRWTDNRLARPFRRRIQARVDGLARRARRLRVEGNLEKRNSRLLATATFNVIIEDMIDYIADEPALNQVIQDQMSHQSRGLANVVADTARDGAVATDDFSERLVRRLLRLTPREDLPPSPYEGKLQTMYSAQSLTKVEDHVDDHHPHRRAPLELGERGPPLARLLGVDLALAGLCVDPGGQAAHGLARPHRGHPGCLRLAQVRRDAPPASLLAAQPAGGGGTRAVEHQGTQDRVDATSPSLGRTEALAEKVRASSCPHF